MRIYVAASSKELDRAKWAINELRALGHTVTHDWPAEVEKVGSANPTDATIDEAASWSIEDLDGVDDAEVLWLLVPEADGFGAGVELGYAICLRDRTFDAPPIHIVCSGPYLRSIFTSLADALYMTDMDALHAEFRSE
jgi:hypothetical protein